MRPLGRCRFVGHPAQKSDGTGLVPNGAISRFSRFQRLTPLKMAGRPGPHGKRRYIGASLAHPCDGLETLQANNLLTYKSCSVAERCG